MSKYCGKCGKENPDGNVFCYFCGAGLYNGELNNINQVNEKKNLLKISKILIGLGIILNILDSISYIIILIDALNIQKYLNILFNIINILNIASGLIIIIGFILLLVIRKKSLKIPKILIGIGIAIWIFLLISLYSLQYLYAKEYISAHLLVLFIWVLRFIGNSSLVIEITGFVSLFTGINKSLMSPDALIGYGIITFFSLFIISAISSSVHLNPIYLFEIQLILSMLTILSGYIWKLINLKNNSYK